MYQYYQTPISYQQGDRLFTGNFFVPFVLGGLAGSAFGRPRPYPVPFAYPFPYPVPFYRNQFFYR